MPGSDPTTGSVEEWGPATLAETHSAVVVFLGDRAYKLKKPVSLGFLDFSTRAAREAACHDEVELNRRFAPDVYLGVADVVGPDGLPCDHLVVMRRLPAHRRLTACLRRGEDVGGALWQIAHTLVTAHAARPPDARWDEVASADAVRGHWDDSSAQMAPYAGALFDAAKLARIEELVHRYLDGRVRLFADRVAHGRVRDGHGDLQADDIFLLADGPRILDCLDFDEHLRWADVLSDAAFLAMDLERLGHPDLGESFLQWQRELAGDTWPTSLAHHYVAYRAHVRAKVLALRWSQGDATVVDTATGFVDQALAHLEQARVRLVLVGGLPGTGKSTLALELGRRLPVVVLRSDEVRDMVTERRGAQGYREGRYRPDQVAATYRDLLHQAGALLERGESVVLDASWSREDHRRAARRLAEDAHAELLELCCEAPGAVADSRLRRRGAAGLDPSEATPEVAARMALHFDPWAEALVIDTSGVLDAAASAAVARYVGRPAGS